jgi:L-cystine uptake protein TcyP (sodium:dicarboxylate symporter family)
MTTSVTINTYTEYFILIPKNVYKRITGVSAKNIVKIYLLMLIPVKAEKKQTTSEGTTGEETPNANI